MSAKSVEFSFSEFCAVTAARPGVRAWCCEAVVGRRPGVGVGGSPPPPSARDLSSLICTPEVRGSRRDQLLHFKAKVTLLI